MERNSELQVILNSLFLLRKGIRWRVGNGSGVRAFVDPWIPLEGGGRRGLGRAREDVMVAEFLREDGDWNRRKLELSFLPHEVEAILTIDRENRREKDVRFWRFDEKGRFTVKSGYLLETGFYDGHGSTSSSATKQWWSHVWQANVPPKVRVFMWRATSNLIPTDENLKKRHIPCSGICSWCRRDWGKVTHCLIFCDKIRGAWKQTEWWYLLKNMEHLSLEDLCGKILAKKGKGEFDKFCMALWWMWTWLCRVKHDPEFRGELELVEGCENQLCSFQEARKNILTRNRCLPQEGERKWKYPPKGMLRLDVDISVHEDGGATGVGFVVRDEKGALIAAAAHRVGRTETILMGELHAMLLGIGYCIEKELGPLLVYSDSMLAIHVVNEEFKGMDSLSDDLFEVFAFAKERIVSAFCHVLREANRVALCLANFAAVSSGVKIWESSFPAWLSDIAARDL